MNPFTSSNTQLNEQLVIPPVTRLPGGVTTTSTHVSSTSFDVPARGFYQFVLIGAGGSGGAFTHTALRYAPGAGGGGGAREIVFVELKAGARVTLEIPPGPKTPSQDGGSTRLVFTQPGAAPKVYQAAGGRGGETWDGVSSTAPVGGWGGESSHPSGNGTKGDNSYIATVSGPLPTNPDTLGGVSVICGLGDGGAGCMDTPYSAGSFGAQGYAIISQSPYLE